MLVLHCTLTACGLVSVKLYPGPGLPKNEVAHIDAADWGRYNTLRRPYARINGGEWLEPWPAGHHLLPGKHSVTLEWIGPFRALPFFTKRTEIVTIKTADDGSIYSSKISQEEPFDRIVGCTFEFVALAGKTYHFESTGLKKRGMRLVDCPPETVNEGTSCYETDYYAKNTMLIRLDKKTSTEVGSCEVSPE